MRNIQKYILITAGVLLLVLGQYNIMAKQAYAAGIILTAFAAGLAALGIFNVDVAAMFLSALGRIGAAGTKAAGAGREFAGNSQGFGRDLAEPVRDLQTGIPVGAARQRASAVRASGMRLRSRKATSRRSREPLRSTSISSNTSRSRTCAAPPSRTVPHRPTPFSTAPYRPTPPRTAPHRRQPFRTAPRHSAPSHTAPPCTMMRKEAPRGWRLETPGYRKPRVTENPGFPKTPGSREPRGWRLEPPGYRKTRITESPGLPQAPGE